MPAAHETEYTVEDYRDHLNASRDLLEGELHHLETIDEHDLAKLPGLRELYLRDASMTDNPDSIHTRSITPIVDEDDLPIPRTLLVSRVNERINVVDHRDFDLGRGDDRDHPDRQPLPDPRQSALEDFDLDGTPGTAGTPGTPTEEGASAEPRGITNITFDKPHEHDYFYDYSVDALWTVGVSGVNEELAAGLHTLFGAEVDTPMVIRSCMPGAPVDFAALGLPLTTTTKSVLDHFEDAFKDHERPDGLQRWSGSRSGARAELQRDVIAMLANTIGQQLRERSGGNVDMISTNNDSLTITITPEVLAIDSTIAQHCAYFGIPSIVSGSVVVEALNGGNSGALWVSMETVMTLLEKSEGHAANDDGIEAFVNGEVVVDGFGVTVLAAVGYTGNLSDTTRQAKGFATAGVGESTVGFELGNDRTSCFGPPTTPVEPQGFVIEWYRGEPLTPEQLAEKRSEIENMKIMIPLEVKITTSDGWSSSQPFDLGTKLQQRGLDKPALLCVAIKKPPPDRPLRATDIIHLWVLEARRLMSGIHRSRGAKANGKSYATPRTLRPAEHVATLSLEQVAMVRLFSLSSSSSLSLLVL